MTWGFLFVVGFSSFHFFSRSPGFCLLSLGLSLILSIYVFPVFSQKKNKFCIADASTANSRKQSESATRLERIKNKEKNDLEEKWFGEEGWATKMNTTKSLQQIFTCVNFYHLTKKVCVTYNIKSKRSSAMQKKKWPTATGGNEERKWCNSKFMGISRTE